MNEWQKIVLETFCKDVWTVLGVLNFLCACDSVIVYSLQRWGCNHIQRNRNREIMRGLSFHSLVLFGYCSWLDLWVSLLCCPPSLLPLNQCVLERECRGIKSNYSIIYILKILKLHCTLRFIAIDKRNLHSIVQFSTFSFYRKLYNFKPILQLSYIF